MGKWDRIKACYRVYCPALAKGKMNRPSYCYSCGKVGVPDGHHEDYEKPLDVLWLCHGCHRFWHRSVSVGPGVVVTVVERVMHPIVQRLEEYRLREGLSQEGIARKANVQYANICTWRRGSKPQKRFQTKLKRFLRRVGA